MNTCKVCQKSYRKGVIAFIMGDRGLKGARVCQGCASDGVLVVAAKAGVTCSCGKPASKCSDCGKKPADMGRAIKALETLVKLAKHGSVRYMHATEIQNNDGRIEGLESAIELLKSGRF
jgi:hypothetical protein